jgi:hypothetical protein
LAESAKHEAKKESSCLILAEIEDFAVEPGRARRCPRLETGPNSRLLGLPEGCMAETNNAIANKDENEK